MAPCHSEERGDEESAFGTVSNCKKSRFFASLRMTRNWHHACFFNFLSGALARHEDKALEEMHILLVLQQCAMEGRDNGLAVLGSQGVGRDVLGEQELQPVEQLGGRGLLLQAGHFAHLEEHLERFAK